MPALRHDNVSSMTEYLQSCCEAWLGTPGLFLEPGMYTPALPELAPEPPPELAPEPAPEPAPELAPQPALDLLRSPLASLL